MMNRIKIHAHADGESDVGIPDYNETIELRWELEDGEERNRVRSIFRDAFSQLVGDACSVTIDDECFFCLRTGGEHNHDCPCAEWKGEYV